MELLKSDKSIHKICIAAIKRKIICQDNFKGTQFYESNSLPHYIEPKIKLLDNELIICSTYLNNKNLSILTTKRLITVIDGLAQIGNLQNASNLVDFHLTKDIRRDYIVREIQLQNGEYIKYFVETGAASLVFVYGLQTLLEITKY